MSDDNHDPKMREFRYRGYHGVPDDEKLNAMSDIELDSLFHSSKDNPVKASAIDREIQRRKKTWYEKPIGLVIISFVSGLLLAGVVFYLRWN